MPISISIALLALLIDAAFGYPGWLYRAIGHPVTWIGALISRLERNLNRPAWTFGARRLAGIVTLLLLLGLPIGFGWVLQCTIMRALPDVTALIVAGLFASSLLAQHSLHAHVADVAKALEKEGVEAGREAVSRIVGRDPARLDEAGISRAAIESLAENFSDGVVAPLFWLVLGGLPGLLAYKAINTADSMIGHKSERYHAFGWASARLDDLVNLPASRLASLWAILAAMILPGASAKEAWRAVARDASQHTSPNAGWPEAAFAGALGLKLAGPRIYASGPIDAAYMGDGRAECGPADIRKALALFRRAAAIQFCALAALFSLLMAI